MNNQLIYNWNYEEFTRNYVAIMLLNWNGIEDTLKCLDSLNQIYYPKEKIGIFIADNASSDNSITHLEEKIETMKKDNWRSIILIKNAQNYGSPKGFNQIFKRIDPQFDIIVRLDNDVIVESDCINHLVHTLITEPTVGIVGGLSYYQHAPTIVCNGAGYIDWGKNKHRYLIPNELTICDVVMGNCMAMRRETIEKLDFFFDDRLFIVADELELCLRVKQKLNLKTAFNPASISYHKGGGSTKKVSNKVAYYAFRNNILIQRWYCPRGATLITAWLLSLLSTIKYSLVHKNRFPLIGFFHGSISRILDREELERWNWN